MNFVEVAEKTYLFVLGCISPSLPCCPNCKSNPAGLGITLSSSHTLSHVKSTALSSWILHYLPPKVRDTIELNITSSLLQSQMHCWVWLTHPPKPNNTAGFALLSQPLPSFHKWLHCVMALKCMHYLILAPCINMLYFYNNKTKIIYTISPAKKNETAKT